MKGIYLGNIFSIAYAKLKFSNNSSTLWCFFLAQGNLQAEEYSWNPFRKPQAKSVAQWDPLRIMPFYHISWNEVFPENTFYCVSCYTSLRTQMGFAWHTSMLLGAFTPSSPFYTLSEVEGSLGCSEELQDDSRHLHMRIELGFKFRNSGRILNFINYIFCTASDIVVYES